MSSKCDEDYLSFSIDTEGNADNESNALVTFKEDSDSNNSLVKRLLKEYHTEKKAAVKKPAATVSDCMPVKKNKLEKEVEDVLKKSVVTADFNKLHSVPTYSKSKYKLQKERRIEREKTKGAKWFGLPATEMTEEVKNDLKILQMRSVLDPKHFYKKNDLKVLPKYFQIGKVMDSPLDFYSSRLTKKERKKTIVDELLADANFQKNNKRKYLEIVEQKNKRNYRTNKKMKKTSKKKIKAKKSKE